jgi:MscS family membrane protein
MENIFTNLFYNSVFAIVVFVIFLFFRKIFTKYIVKFLNFLAKNTKNTIDDKILSLLIEPIRFSIIIVGLYISLQIISISNGIIDNIFRSLFFFIIFWFLYNGIVVFNDEIKQFSKNFGKELFEEINLFITKAIKIFIVIIALVIILQVWNINVSAFIASLGLGGLAFALAAKDTASNLFGGLTLLADKSLKMKDWIKVGSVEGVVEEIGLRTTKIRTFEKSLITMPNQILANTPVENFSRRGVRRIKFRVSITYDTSSNVIENVVKEIRYMLENHEYIEQNETMLVRFDKFEDSNLSIFIYTFTSTSNWAKYLEIKEDINIKVIKIIETNKSEFAFPSQTIYVKNDEYNV